MRILFVCTGNTCRSPMCETYFKHLCRQAGRTDVLVVSAGVCAGGGEPMSIQAAEVLTELGIESDAFRNRQLTATMLADADLIVAMSASHVRQIGMMAPEVLDKTRMLMEYADCGRTDVADPFGGTIEVYRHCFKAMKTALDNLFLELSQIDH